LGADVAVAIVSVSLGKLDLQRGIALGPLRVRTDEITRQRASCSLKLPARRRWMWVRWLPGGSRKYRFVRSVLSARKTQPRRSSGAKSIERLKRRDRDLYVDDRLGGQTRHR